MRIELRHRYKSIEVLETEYLPDFAILIGRNGAGKTQLLEALNGGRAAIPGIGADEIELHNSSSFHPPNIRQGGRNTNQFALNTADAYLLSQSGSRSPIKTAAAIFDQFVSDIGRQSGAQACDDFVRSLRAEIQQMPDFTVFAAGGRQSPYERALYEQVLAPLSGGQGGRSLNKSRNSFNGSSAALLSAAMKLAGKLPHELTRTDIMRASLCEGDTLSNSISRAFAGYKIVQSTWAYERFDNETERVNRVELINEYQTANPPPWEALRRILSEMRDAAGDDGLFNFDFSDPSHDELSVTSLERYSFAAVMTNRTSGAQYDLDSLSSGEKILMALCLVSFNQYLGQRRPKLLLLDELDTVLHPSMVTALVTLLKDLFVSQGTKVLMTSHSPMTVAALDEADIFRVVRKGGSVNVSRATKSEAINELSEGLATVDVGLRIAAYGGAKVTILTEGHNAKHLKRWVEVMGLSEEVHVFDELGQRTSAGELRTYGRLLGKMNTSTPFIVVWDCDAASEAEGLRQELHGTTKVTPFSFERRPENTIARRGIENNYNEELLKPFSIKKMDNDGTFLGREFHKDRKTEFANHVLQQGKPEDFTHFQDLYDTVTRILESPQ